MRVSRTLAGDLVAGVSVAVVLIPQSLAYADLAGMPHVAGLYAAALPPLAAAIFASSPYLQTGPVAITALLTFGALSSMATPGSAEYATLGLGLALLVGVVRIALGLLRAGWVAYLMSQPMLLGFVPAAALLIAASQLPSALGVTERPGHENQFVEAGWVLGHPDGWAAAAVLVTAATLVVVIGGRRVHALFPGVLVMAIVTTLVSDSGGYDGPTVDELPAGLPPFTLDDLPAGRLPELVVSAVVIALIGFTEAVSISRRYAAEERTRWDPDREFVSQGVANVVAAASGGMPCGGSISRSSVARASGARTRRAGGITGLTVLAFLPVAGIIEPLPLATLAAVVMASVVGLLRFGPLVTLWRLSAPQAVIAWSTFIAALVLAPRIDIAVLIGIGMSLGVFVWRALQLDIDVRTEGATLRLLPRGVLWFGTAQRLDAAVLEALAAHDGVARVEIDLSGLGRIDTTGALVLGTVLEHLRAAGLEAELHGIPPQSEALTRRILDSGTDLV